MTTTVVPPDRARALLPPRVRVEPVLQPAWPVGAWLARCHIGSDVVELLHGRQVEVTPEWFGENVWAGPYAAGDFDRTDVVFGSGGRIRGPTITFVAASSTVDRLHSLDLPGETWISNSLICLLVASGAQLDPTYVGYAEDFTSIVRGLSRYRRHVSTSVGAVRLTYFDNLLWDGAVLRSVPKPDQPRDLQTFERYRAFLDEALAGFAENMADPARAVPYQFLGTISSGYDSATIATLARAHGLSQVVTFAAARSGEPDSGAEIASLLGLRMVEVAREAWRDRVLPEVPFLAADAKGEDVYFAGAGELLGRRVLLTGFHGDKMWDVRTRAVSPDIVRGDQSGLSLSEFRLRAGFVHLPLPFLGVRQIRDVHALSVSPALAAWHTGRRYSRPICRRIVEGAGVPRRAFGQRKKAASVLFDSPEHALSPESLADFLSWLDERAGAWRQKNLVAPDPVAGRRSAQQLLAAAAAWTVRATAGRNPTARAIAGRLAYYGSREPLLRHYSRGPWNARVKRAGRMPGTGQG
jgi:hypothetical protein